MTGRIDIPFLDLAPVHGAIRAELDSAWRRVADSQQFILGAEVERFEADFAGYCGVAHCIGVSNGLDALRLLLRALDVGAGDEVIVPSNTFIATWLAVSQVGAHPVPVEPDAGSCNLDPGRLEAAISGRTRAIIAVHLYGQPAAMAAINELAGRHDIPIIEDAAQAHGARLQGRTAGSLALAGAFSFYPAKNLGALGDAGAVTTDDAALAERVRLLRNYGSARKYHNEVQGENSRLDPLQAALLGVKLKHLDGWNAQRREQAALYRELLGGDERFRLQESEGGVDSSWHLFTVRSARRDALQAHLEAAGIGTLVHYPEPPHRSGAYTGAGDWGELPIADEMAATTLSLPIGPHLAPEQIRRVARTVLEFR